MSGIGEFTMIALLNNGEYFIDGCESINEFLITYATYIGAIDIKVLKILIDSNEMSTKELVNYINDNAHSHNDKIVEIYEIDKKIY